MSTCLWRSSLGVVAFTVVVVGGAADVGTSDLQLLSLLDRQPCALSIFDGSGEGTAEVTLHLKSWRSTAILEAPSGSDETRKVRVFPLLTLLPGRESQINCSKAGGWTRYSSGGFETTTSGVRLGEVTLPKGLDYEDEYFGAQEIYRDRFFATIPYEIGGARPEYRNRWLLSSSRPRPRHRWQRSNALDGLPGANQGTKPERPDADTNINAILKSP